MLHLWLSLSCFLLAVWSLKISFSSQKYKESDMRPKLPFRVGQGYDIHRLAPGNKLIIAGEHIPSQFGSVAHSDGDVVFHCLADAIFGSLALPDIGQHFPDNDPNIKNINSLLILQKALASAQERGYEIANVDASIILQSPKLKPHMEKMRKNVAEGLGIATGDVGLKARTKEELGPVGQGKAIECHCVVLLSRREEERKADRDGDREKYYY